jgi:hypothetical protein
MGKFKNLFQKPPIAARQATDPSASSEHDLISEMKNWYSDRYEILLVQRSW